MTRTHGTTAAIRTAMLLGAGAAAAGGVGTASAQIFQIDFSATFDSVERRDITGDTVDLSADLTVSGTAVWDSATGIFFTNGLNSNFFLYDTMEVTGSGTIDASFTGSTVGNNVPNSIQAVHIPSQSGSFLFWRINEIETDLLGQGSATAFELRGGTIGSMPMFGSPLPDDIAGYPTADSFFMRYRVSISDTEYGFSSSNVSVTYTVVPAPASVALMGLAGLAATRRRR